MVTILYPIVDLICIIILAFLEFQNEKYINFGIKQTFFRNVVVGSLIFSIIDLFWGCAAGHFLFDSTWLILATTLYLGGAAWLATIWVRFVIYYLEIDKEKKFTWLLYLLCMIPFLISLLLLFVNLQTGILFYVQDDEYTRGSDKYLALVYGLQYFDFLMALIIATFSSFRSVKEKKSDANQKSNYSVCLFALLPIITSILQHLFYNLPFHSIGFMLGSFVIYIYDLVSEKEKATASRIMQHQKQVFEKCSSLMNHSDSVKRNLDSLMKLLVSCYNADSVYIMEFTDWKNEAINCKYEFCKNGIESHIQELQKIPAVAIEPWRKHLAAKEDCFIENLGKLAIPESQFTKVLTANNVNSILITPLKKNGNLFGFIVINNPLVPQIDYTNLRIISMFIYSELLRRNQILEEQKTSGAVLMALASEYLCVYFIDVKTGELKPYRYDQQIKNLYEDYYKNKISYKAAFEMYVEDLVVGDYKEKLKPYSDVEFVAKKLRFRNNVKIQFLSQVNGKEEFFQAKWVKVNEDSENPTAFVLGFANVDEQVRSKELLYVQEQQIKTQKQQLVSAQEKAEKAKLISQLDRLTEVYNKFSGQELVKEYLEAKPQNEKYALIFIDIDKFKKFNDKYGHLVGDEILMEVGKTIKNKCRQNDIPIRFGGDEFVIVLKNQKTSNPSVKKAEAIQKDLETLSLDKDWKLTCSIGIYVTASDSFDLAVEAADKALYEVKDSGRNSIKVIE